MNDGPLIVQSDKTILLEVDHELATEARHAIAPFAELERAPEHVHSYRLTPLGLWNARAAGLDAERVLDTLLKYSRFPVPHSLLIDVEETMSRYGRLRLEKDPQHGLVMRTDDYPVLEEVIRSKKIQPLLGPRIDGETVVVHASQRGQLKQLLLKIGWPAEDLAGYVDGTPHLIALNEDGWKLRPYQQIASDNFWAGGSGVVVLPCGAGKTLVGAAAMATGSTTTLILVTNTVAARQWKDELLKRTSLTEDEIGEYSGALKEVRPVTIATYQVLTTKRGGLYPHLELVDGHDWGLIIYDEVHLLPAPIFRMTADLQARRRLGLTATLVREDGREGEVFSLIGPKRYDAPWKDIESQGYIAPADCVEVRVDLPRDERVAYAMAEDADKYRLCATSESKTQVVEQLVARHSGEQLLVIGQYIDQLDELGERLQAPVIKGDTSVKVRQKLFDAFRAGELQTVVVSKVANFSIDLPEASVAIQVSGSFGSRQEEAQRLGRLLRPKKDGRAARFYSLVARDTLDQDFAAKRQRFLAEQGYAYRIMDAKDVETADQQCPLASAPRAPCGTPHTGSMRRPVEPDIPRSGQESAWDYPRPPRVEPSEERIRIVLGGELILDTSESLRVLETSHPPVYYFRREAFRAGTLEPAPGSSYCEFKGIAHYLNVLGGAGTVAVAAAWFYPEPSPGYASLADCVALYPGRMDYCEVGGERVRPQAGSFYGGWITSRVVGPFKGEAGTAFW